MTIEEVRWWGFVPGATVFACDLESAEGRRLWARLVEGAPPGSARATPLGALVEHVKRCRSLSEVKATCEALVSRDLNRRVARQCRRDVGTGGEPAAARSSRFPSWRGPERLPSRASPILFGLALLMVGAKVGGLAGGTVGTALGAR